MQHVRSRGLNLTCLAWVALNKSYLVRFSQMSNRRRTIQIGSLTIKDDYRPMLLIKDNFMPSAVAAGFENGCDIVIKRTSAPDVSYSRATRQSLSGVRVGYESNYVLNLFVGLNRE